jgi:hypothetical protein
MCVTPPLHTVDENNAGIDLQRHWRCRSADGINIEDQKQMLNHLTPFHHQQQHTPEHQWPQLQGY